MARDPKAEVEITAHSRGLASKLREARAKFASFGSEIKKHVFGKDLVEKGFWSKGGAQLVGNLGSRAIGGAFGFLAEQAKEVYQYNDGLTRLQINANATGEEMAQLARHIRHASDATGISRMQILGAARQYVALTGDIKGTTAAIETWTRVAQAEDSTVGDVASTAQALRDNLKIDPAQMSQAFDIIAGQGKAGAVEMKDLATQLATVTPLMAQFSGGTGIKGLADLGATIQIVRKGFGSTEETITGVQSLMTALIKNAKRFHAAGVQVFDVDAKTGAKHLKSFREIIDAIGDSRLAKDPSRLEKAFGRVEAYRAYLQLQANKHELDELADSARYAGTTQKDLATYSHSTAGKLKIAWEKAKNEIADVFTPSRIDAFATALGKAVDMFAKLVGYIDRTSRFVDHVVEKVMGPTVKERVDDEFNHEVAFEKKNPVPKEALFDLAAKYRKKYSQLYLKQDHGGLNADEQVEMEVDRKLAERYTQQGTEAYGAGYDPKVLKHMSKTEFAQEQAKIAAQQMGTTTDGHALFDRLIGTLRLLAIELGKHQPVQVKVGADTVAEANRAASSHARRPGA